VVNILLITHFNQNIVLPYEMLRYSAVSQNYNILQS